MDSNKENQNFDRPVSGTSADLKNLLSLDEHDMKYLETIDRINIEAVAYVETEDDEEYDQKRGRGVIELSYKYDNGTYAAVEVKSDGTTRTSDFIDLSINDGLDPEVYDILMGAFNKDFTSITSGGNPWQSVKRYLKEKHIDLVYSEDKAFENELKAKQSIKDHEIYESIVHPHL